MIARILIIWLALMIPAAADPVPEGFVEIRDIIPDPVMDIRYVTDHNFLGTPVDGYRASRCYLTKEAATALAGVQTDFKPFGFSIKLYDCYRPQRVVGHFVRWAKILMTLPPGPGAEPADQPAAAQNAHGKTWLSIL